MFTLILLSLVASSVSSLVVSRGQELRSNCSAITDCDRCLMIPACFAIFSPTFSCLNYPVLDTNSDTVVVQNSECCPTALKFNSVDCGFGVLKPEFNFLYVYIGSAMGVVLIIVTAAIVAFVICRRRRRGRFPIRSPLNLPGVNAPCATSAIQPSNVRRASHVSSARSADQSTSGTTSSRQPSVKRSGQSLSDRKEFAMPTGRACERSVPRRPDENQRGNSIKSLHQLLQEEIKSTAANDWEMRRATLRHHPLDQSTEN